jgi:SIT4 phosphatase-associated protein
MIPFIQSIPDIVPKLLRHIETSAIMDLLLKIISMEKSEPGAGIVEVYISLIFASNISFSGSMMKDLYPHSWLK